MFVSGLGGLRFKSQAGQIEHSVANSLPQLQHFLKRICVACRRNDSEMGPATGYTLWRNTTYSKYNERFNLILKQCSHQADFFQQIGDLSEQGQIIFGNIVNVGLENSTNLWKYDI